MQWVSIKIMTAEATTYSPELGILQSLAKRCNGSLNSKLIVQLLDEFTHQGPNGTHQCLVFELLGPTVDLVTRDYGDYNDPEQRLEPDIVMRISEQLLSAITFIHEAGYGHGGTTSHELFAAAAILFSFFSAADLRQILAAEILLLHVVICRRRPKKTCSTFLAALNQRNWLGLMASH